MRRYHNEVKTELLLGLLSALLPTHPPTAGRVRRLRQVVGRARQRRATHAWV